MNNKWLYNIRHVAPGEPVKSEIVGRPDRALEERTSYLKERLEAAEAGRALFDTDVTIAPDVLAGQPVYWNYSTQRYERAIAAVEADDSTQTLIVQPSSDCVGILYAKKSANLGDVVLYGIVKLPEITNAITGAPVAGRYYLSATDPGKLVKQRPAVTVPVCLLQGVKDNCADDPWIVVMPQIRDFLEDHIHYRFELETVAAGIVEEDVDGHCTITSPQPTIAGWLPANHAIFNGKAPAGAVFGYNISEHLALSRVWPPLPIQAVAMLWDKGQELVGATEIPLGATGAAICDTFGIWWMSDCVADLPWVRDLSSASSASSDSSSSSAGAECPREERMRVIVVYLRMLLGNDRSVVTSLKPAPGSPITVVNCEGLAATTGDLELDLNLELAVIPPNVSGAKVLKRVENHYNLRAGLVTEGIVSGSPPIVLTSVSEEPAASRALTNAEKTALGFDPDDAITAYQGLVKITFDDTLVEREISPQIIRLSDVVERLYVDIPYLGFPAGQDSHIRIRLNVPSSGLGTGLTMRVRTQLFGRITGTLPDLALSHRVLSRPSSPSLMPLIDISPTPVFTTGIPVVQDTAVEIMSATFSVDEGDTVLVTIRRPLILGNPDAYLGEVGLLRISGIIATT